MMSSTFRGRLAQPQSTIAPGRQIREYEALSLLGEGGMGKVFRVRHQLLGTEHALKIPLLDTQEQRFRFIQEARVTASLRHAFINRATDLFEWDGRLCMVTDLVQGLRIDDWVRSRRPSQAARVRALVGVADAVSVAHEAHVLHRDLTPSNVMISHADDEPCLLDFGACQDMEALVALTRTGLVVGKIGFIAPEILRGSAPSVRSDIYQLALLARVVLDPDSEVFPQGDERERMHCMVRGLTNPMSNEITPSLREVIQRGMAAEPGERFASCAALRDALASAIRGDAPVRPKSAPAATLAHTTPALTQWFLQEDAVPSIAPDDSLPDLNPLRTALLRWAPVLVFGLCFLIGLLSFFFLI